MFKLSKQIQHASFVIFCVLSFLITRFYLVTDVPGFHFDEAWQALYGWRIATEPGFWPTRAMNDYTWPVVHYGLAIAFKFFGPSLLVERFFHQFLQIVGIAMILLALRKVKVTLQTYVWIVLPMVLLPYFIHTQRYYVEMTSLFTFCAGLSIWGIALWHEHPKTAALFCVLGAALGTYAHVLFIAPLLTGIILFCTPTYTHKRHDIKHLVAALALFCILPVLLRMHFALNKFSTLVLVVVISAMFIGQILFYIKSFAPLVRPLEKHRPLVLKILALIALPFLIPYLVLFIDGSWSYAQVTGAPLGRLWLPVNLAILLYVIFRTKNLNVHKQEQLALVAFVLSFVLTSIIILKQSPRYYVVPSLLGLLWFGLKASRLTTRTGALIALIFIGWNGYAFFNRYIEPYQSYGAQDKTYRFLIFKDSARDMRPFQKVFAWLEERGCLHTLKGVEDDRFYRALEFYQLRPEPAMVNSTNRCPWASEDLHFRSKPSSERKDFPGNLELLAQSPEWGDLALWLVRH